MVAIAQLVEHRVVVAGVAGSSPVSHPIRNSPDPQRIRAVAFCQRVALRTMLEMDAPQFEALVADELDRLPDDMVDGLDNIVFVVEDRPEDGSLDLLGLYDGLALTERAQYGLGDLPDRIIVYREPHLDVCDDVDELRDEVHTTLVHEIAHFYGIDDDRLHELGWA